MNMKRIVAAALGLCVMCLAATASADLLILRDGTRAEGTVVGIVAQTITFRHADGAVRRYSTGQVEALEFLSAQRGNRGAAVGRRLEAPAGTQLVVRTAEAIDSKRASEDQTFAAVLEDEVTNASGRVIMPEGSSARLVIRHLPSDGSGGREGDREMVLDLTRENDTGIGTNTRTAATIGGGAVIGSIIGAITGGGKGAAIGGAVGAAGGAATQVLTRGRDVRVPAETVLTFRLDRAITLRSVR
jgi:hypothetical protein